MSEPFDAWALPSGFAPGDTAQEHDGLRRLPLDEAAARALCAALRAARSGLLAHDAAARARLIGRAGARFLDPADPLRREADERVAEHAGLSAPMARAVIDGMARDWTAPRLLALLAAELPDPRALDRFVAGGAPGQRVRAFAPALSVHVGAGTVPGVTATSLVRSLLVGSPALVKPGRGDVVLPVLLARALAEEAPDLARAAAVLYWPGGTESPAERVALAEADLVVVYGNDETVRSVRARVPVATPVVAYHHRMSVALVGREALGADALGEVADALARAVAMFDQRGCVSPHAVLVEEGGASSPADLARALADALARLDRELPPGPVDAAEASAVQQLRGAAELRAAAGEEVALHAGAGVSWTVVLERAGTVEPSCLGRTVRVHPVADARAAADLLAPARRHLQTVGVAGLGGRAEAVADALARLGAARICALADMAFPPPWWHHDGRGPLRALLRWVDWEG